MGDGTRKHYNGSGTGATNTFKKKSNDPRTLAVMRREKIESFVQPGHMNLTGGQAVAHAPPITGLNVLQGNLS